MKEMQKHHLKFLVTICVIASAAFQSNAQTSVHRLKVADSLFLAKRYTQSLEHYEAVFKNNEYSPAMLLRMAYIEEGLDNMGKALYYLTLYYEVTHDPSTLRKMEELAAKYNLEGYRQSDTDELLSIYYEYYFYITASLAAVVLFFLALAFYRKVRTKRRPIAIAVTIWFFLCILGVHLFIGEKISVAIIAQSQTYLMTGPSAGADVVEIASEGHRIEVIGKKDVWLKIRWKGSVAYIKQHNALPVTFSNEL